MAYLRLRTECPTNGERESDNVRNENMGTVACQPRYTEVGGCDWLPVLAFVPVQELKQVYEPERGFCRGTIFPELDKPFEAGGCVR